MSDNVKKSSLIPRRSQTRHMDDAARRDELALERTRLANERTLLAYIRTALTLFAGGAALLQFFPSRASLLGVGWLLVFCGVAMLVVGGYRFVHVKRRFEAT
jgi:putative membrane protein